MAPKGDIRVSLGLYLLHLTHNLTLMVYPKDSLGSPITVGQSHGPVFRPAAAVFAASWLLSVPWAVIHGPVELKWVVAQALGASVIPTVAGWLTLWRTRGDLKAGLVASAGAVIVLLVAAVWAGTRS
jgi:hypothetical protein